MEIRVIDDYFPSWIVDQVSVESTLIPVSYSNSPYADYNSARFFGTNLIKDDNWLVSPWWFVTYLNLCIKNDICAEYNIKHCSRVLLNGQAPGQHGCNHADADYDCYLSVLYHAHGDSGDTVFVNSSDEDVKRVSFKRGRLIIFNSSIWHRGEAPEHGYRTSLGCVYPTIDIKDLPHD